MQATILPDLPYLDHPAPATTKASGPVTVPTLSPTMVASGLRRDVLNRCLTLVETGLTLHYLRSPSRIRQAGAEVQVLRQAYYGNLRVQKVAHVAGRYYREFQTPGWPSVAHARYVATTLHRLTPFRPDAHSLQMVFLAITKKCPLACAHCFEWDALNQREKLTLPDLRRMVAEFQSRHVTQILFSGGEPMLRVHDILDVLRTAQPGTDFWVFTSGFHFTRKNAQLLKHAGLTGVSISLDHHDPAQHNAFRGSPDAYQHAINAAQYAHEAGLVVALTVCATREFTTPENLMAYARLAKQLGVTFIHILEPRAVGHYAGQVVDLGAAELELLEEFYLKLNYSKDYLDWPIVHYYGYHQRRMGCSGAADRFLYVDTDGDMHACPFCQQKAGSALTGALDTSLAALKCNGCKAFAHAPI
ncbi:radical SAM protein [Hymenobacter mucosus]|uniref:Radical SAM superfamily enzyme, MoaA/NifB/PqqE/SkfB family n=1 Tax=Hymenobacter mucosus TaxID=1411120 RepID=A0A238VEK4_9BACT|nr:radical SAM protein [Hymenobacter mucosus]SNR32103.1 Radical SAM superfamily enzyme, MoaA/NifB/PqqE/SkfB family [Hymenobacter mucosus]